MLKKVLEGQTKISPSEVKEGADSQGSGENPKPIKRREDQEGEILEGTEKMPPLGPIPSKESGRGYVGRRERGGHEWKGIEFKRTLKRYHIIKDVACKPWQGANRRLWKKVFKRINWSKFLSTKVIFWFLMNRREGNVYRRRGCTQFEDLKTINGIDSLSQSPRRRFIPLTFTFLKQFPTISPQNLRRKAAAAAGRGVPVAFLPCSLSVRPNKQEGPNEFRSLKLKGLMGEYFGQKTHVPSPPFISLRIHKGILGIRKISATKTPREPTEKRKGESQQPAPGPRKSSRENPPASHKKPQAAVQQGTEEPTQSREAQAPNRQPPIRKATPSTGNRRGQQEPRSVERKPKRQNTNPKDKFKVFLHNSMALEMSSILPSSLQCSTFAAKQKEMKGKYCNIPHNGITDDECKDKAKQAAHPQLCMDPPMFVPEKNLRIISTKRGGIEASKRIKN
ncbi:hypothetical protein M5K25_014087 [Dendrobium thyrsiflorum]|uniref:Uncharacterized protein n=1 Tax=Dendrobium thyrsiflorum TaxID=117978 RepID=A0ABD0UUI2_DENTH